MADRFGGCASPVRVSMSERTPVGSGGLMLTGASAALRSRLQALPWMVLEQLGFDAHLDSGRLVAASSARRIAEQLKVDPGAVAAALRVLRKAGIVDLVHPGTSRSRFDLASYLLGETPGLLVLRAGAPPQQTGRDSLAPRPDRAATGPHGRDVPTSELSWSPSWSTALPGWLKAMPSKCRA